MTARRLSALILFAALLLSLSFAFASPLPSELSDSEFWRLTTDFSEPDGYFRFENFVSNELEYQSVIPVLKEATRRGGVYLGVGPEQNFTYIAAIEPKIAFIVDIRRQNLIELLMYKALFELSSDRADFISRLFARPRPSGLTGQSSTEALFTAFLSMKSDPAFFAANIVAMRKVLVETHRFSVSAEDLENLEYVYRVFVDSGPQLDYTTGGGARGGSYIELMTATDSGGQSRSFLASEDNFKLVQRMERRNLIVPIVGDFAGPKAIRAVAQYLKDHGAIVSAFYVSNVEQYLFQQDDDWSRFYANASMLPMDRSSRFIRSARFAYPAGLRQLPRSPSNGNFLSLLSPMAGLIDVFKDGHLESYNQVIEMSK